MRPWASHWPLWGSIPSSHLQNQSDRQDPFHHMARACISMCTPALPQAQLVKKKRVITTVLSKTHLLEWLGYEGWYKGQNSGLRGTSNRKVDRPKTWRIHNTLDVGKGIRWNEKELNFFSVRGEEMVKSTLRLIHTGFFYWNGQRKSGHVRTLSSFSFSYIIHHNDAF